MLHKPNVGTVASRKVQEVKAAPIAAPTRYGHLSRAELVALLERRDREGARIGLGWAADKAERDRALNDDFVTLRLDTGLSDRAGPWSNLLIEGENFDALRWLRMTMRGRVKAIYVDPPYNTGNKDWVYNDDYRDKTDPFFQTAWLEFLHRRFALARDILTDDGVILVSINDENRAVLELMLDQTLPGMKVGSLVWRKRDTKNGAPRNLSDVHEHVLVYAGPKFNFLGKQIDDAKYRSDDGDSRGRWGAQPITSNKSHLVRPRTYYPIQDPKTGWWYPCDPDSVWRFSTSARLKKGEKTRAPTIEAMIDDGRIVFSAKDCAVYSSKKQILDAIKTGSVPKNGNGVPLLRADLPDLDFWIGKPIGLGRPSQKVFWRDVNENVRPLGSWIASSSSEVADDDSEIIQSERQKAGRGALKELFGADVFDNPKPVSLIKELLWASTGPGDTVLDFFAGSGTTAQAVMELNAEDGGDRRFILVSHDERTSLSPDRNLARDVMRERVVSLNKRYRASGIGEAAPFAYLRTLRIPTEGLMDDGALTAEDVWLAIRALHGLTLTSCDRKSGIQIGQDGAVAVAFCDTVTETCLSRLKDMAEHQMGIQAYAWTVGPIRRALEGFDAECHRLPDALWNRFKS